MEHRPCFCFSQAGNGTQPVSSPQSGGGKFARERSRQMQVRAPTGSVTAGPQCVRSLLVALEGPCYHHALEGDCAQRFASGLCPAKHFRNEMVRTRTAGARCDQHHRLVCARRSQRGASPLIFPEPMLLFGRPLVARCIRQSNTQKRARTPRRHSERASPHPQEIAITGEVSGYACHALAGAAEPTAGAAGQ